MPPSPPLCRRKTATLWLTAVLVLLSDAGARLAEAKPEFRAKLPNGYNVPGHMALGHTCVSGTSSGKNSFGEAFDDADKKWTAALCNADTDGDGQSNGLELGDPNCVWIPGHVPHRTWDISDPSNPLSISALSPAPAIPNLFPAGAVAVAISIPQTLFRGAATVNWTVYATGTTPKPTDVLEVQLSISTDYYIAFGIAPVGMSGAMTACYTDATGLGTCTDLLGNAAYQVSKRPQRTQVVSASYGATRTVAFRSYVGDFGNVNGTVRAIFAYGKWDADGAFPLQHGGGSTTAAMHVDVYGGVIASFGTNTEAWVSQGVGVVITLIISVIGGLLNRAQFVPTRTQQTVFTVLITVVYFAILIFIFFFARHGYLRLAKASAAGRAFGDVVTFLFFLVLWPTTKHIGPVQLAGISYERFLSPHQAVGFLIFAFMTVHGALLWSNYDGTGACRGAGTATVMEWDPKAATQNAAGPIAWLLLVLMIIPAMFLRRRFFTIFRAFHALFLLIIVFGALHHWQLWIFIAPGLLCWFVDVAFRVHTHFSHAPTVRFAEYLPAAGVIDLRLAVTREAFTLRPGQYVFIGFTHIPSFLHPFSIVRYEDRVVRFLIKPNGKGTWTRKLQEAIEASENLGKVLWFGPYGTLQVPLEIPRHVVLVAGGIGVTPMLSTIQYIADQRAGGALANLQSVTLIWSVRERALADMIAEILVSDITRLRGLPCTVRIHLTRADLPPESPAVTPSCSPTLPADPTYPGGGGGIQFVGGRPDYDRYLEPYDLSDAVYVCGPAQVVEAVSTAAAHRRIPLHVETFEF